MNETEKNVITEPPAELRTAIAVIGSGPGGAVTAGILAEAGREVLLIEEGPFLPLESCAPFSREEMTQKYRSGGLTPAMGPTKVACVEGRCVGGGSEINSGLYHRTPPEVLERWRREFAIEALGEADLLPHFEACERDLSVSPLSGEAPRASLRLHEGAEKLGWKSLEVPRWFKDGEGGGRQSMTRTFVPRALAAGARLLPETKITSLRRRGDRWLLRGEHRSADGGPRAVETAAETVFVACGPVQTPALLRRSGLGRNIGGLRLHPTVKVVAKFPEEVNSEEMGVPVHQVKEFSPRLTLGCSVSTPAYLALSLTDHPERVREVEGDWKRMAVYYAATTGGRGSVRNLPFFRDPLVRYKLSQEDMAGLSDGLKKLCRALLAAGAEALYPGVPGLGPLTSEADLEKIPAALPRGRTSLMSIHLFSSCPMGENKKLAAVDSFGRVHGEKNLRVADAGLLCDAPGVNPQGTVMALAARNALEFLGKL